jgi:hypothetical protein
MKTRVSSFAYPPAINRCQHIKVNGVQCGSPALKSRKLCHFHHRWQQGRIQLNANRARRSRYSLDLPILEDANSIQVALMQAMRLLLTNQVDHKTAALLFYGLQTASTNLRRTKFEPLPEQVVIDPRGVPNTSLGDNAWYKEEFEENEEQSDNEESTQDLQASADEPAAKESGRVDLQAMAEDPPERPVKSCRNSLPPVPLRSPENLLRRRADRFEPAADIHLGVRFSAKMAGSGTVSGG